MRKQTVAERNKTAQELEKALRLALNGNYYNLVTVCATKQLHKV